MVMGIPEAEMERRSAAGAVEVMAAQIQAMEGLSREQVEAKPLQEVTRVFLHHRHHLLPVI